MLEQVTGALGDFIDYAFPCFPLQVIAILLEEGKDDLQSGQGHNQSHIAVSEGYTQIDTIPILEGRI